MRQRMEARVAVAIKNSNYLVLQAKALLKEAALGAGGGTRTRTRFPAMDFESISAANFDTPARYASLGKTGS